MRQLARYLRSVSYPLIWAIMGLAVGVVAQAEATKPVDVSFSTSDDGEIHAHLYGSGDQAVVLAHGAVFDKESWSPLVGPLAEAGYQVLAIDFRGYGQSRPGSQREARYLDILAAISYLRAQGAERVSVVGASLGGGATARAAVAAGPGEIDRLVLLAPAAIPHPEKMRASRIVYITAEGDPSLARTRQQYDRAPDPKRLELLTGNAHAQHIFKTDQAEVLNAAIVAALTE